MEVYLPWIWLLLFIVFVVIEAGTFCLTTIWCAIASIPLIFISRTGIALYWQLLIFVLLSFILLIFTRPFALKKLKIGKEKTNVDSLEGQHVIVTKAVTSFQKGEAKTKNGVIWTVQNPNDSDIQENTECVITKVMGNTLEIKPV